MTDRLSRRSFLTGLAACTITPQAIAQAATAQSHRFTIAGAEVDLLLTPITPSTLRISIVTVGSGLEPATSFTDKGLVDQQWPPVKDRITTAGSIQWGKFKITTTADPFAINIHDDADTQRQRLTFDTATGKVNFDLQNTPVFGLGEGGHQFDRRGVIDQMRNGQFKPDQFINGGRSPIPWLISPAGWGIFFHHPMGTFDLTGPEGVFRPSEPAQPHDIFLILVSDSGAPDAPATILKEFANLTGHPHLPPIWAFGYQQSHRTLSGRQEVLDEVQTFREKKLPCDVMIYLGTGYAPSGWNTGHGSFAFNEKIFPDPATMFTQMHNENMRVVLHVLGVPFDLHGRISDRSPDPDNAANYWRDHLDVLHTGIDGWWVDDGDELLPAARLVRNRMYWEGSLHEHPNTRPFALHRNGYAGLQQYGFLWSGDTEARWQTLRTHVATGLNTGLSGIPYWGTDTGGFFSTNELSAELYVRWFQYSAFCPLFRSHGRTWQLRRPWGWDTGSLGPVEDDPKLLPSSNELHHPEVEPICQKYLNLRYQLLPYLYSSTYQTHTTGIPLMRALWLAYPKDSQARLVDDAYLWGDSILVAPVTALDAKDRAVYLPSGAWYNFWTQQKISGNITHTAEALLDTLPLFVRAGSIIPLGPIRQYTTQSSSAPLDIHIYPGADAHFVLYEDDGLTMDHTRGIFSLIDFYWNDTSQTLTISLAPNSHLHPFTTRSMNIHIVGKAAIHSLTFDGARKTWTSTV
jgi:alpha-glucosidase (family GH31 glycosyl hydrolase)